MEQLLEMMVSPAWKGKTQRLIHTDSISKFGEEIPTFKQGRNPRERKKNHEVVLVEFVKPSGLIVLFPPVQKSKMRILGCY